MIEVAVPTHLICTDVHEEYSVRWVAKFADLRPRLTNGLPTFIIISSTTRVEMNTVDMKRIEECAKHITSPHGRSSRTTDKARVYIKEDSGKDTLVAIITHDHVRKYQQMMDKVGYR